MPFKSEAQKIKFQQLLKDGKITQKIYDEYDKSTVDKLPARAPKKTKTGVRAIRRVK